MSILCRAQMPELVPVLSKTISQTIDLPGELQAFQSVDIHAKVRGYVDQMLVDRGSVVQAGQLLATLSAPEMKAQLAEAHSKVSAAESDRLQAEAQLAAAQSTYARLQKAAETQGAISANELEQAQLQVKAGEAAVQSRKQAAAAMQDAVNAQKELEAYLRITAPFSGVITERLVHPGALVGPASDPVLLILQDVGRLRLVVAVPEQDAAASAAGLPVEFHVPAFPKQTYTGRVARISHALDAKTRTMAVELDVTNRDRSLSPGMYPTVKWPVRHGQASLLVPKTSIVTTTERTFVIKDRGGKAEWVNVTRGVSDGELVEVTGKLQPGEKVVKRATDEIREGTQLQAK
jgi:RND family efflux transporter MFP subunit